MPDLFWRLAPIFFLSVRQFIGGKAVRAVFALGLVPALFTLVYRVNPDMERPRRFLDNIVIDVMLPTILPLAALILATAAFGDEIDDRTLPYLVLKPITRLRIVIEKLLAAVVVSIPMIAMGGLVSWLLVFTSNPGDNLDLLWASVFLLISLLIRRAILAAIIYSIVWESVLGRFISGLRYLSIQHLVRSVYSSTVTTLEPNGRRDIGLGIDNAFGICHRFP